VFSTTSSQLTGKKEPRFLEENGVLITRFQFPPSSLRRQEIVQRLLGNADEPEPNSSRQDAKTPGKQLCDFA
jgi:hypothetical protein